MVCSHENLRASGISIGVLYGSFLFIEEFCVADMIHIQLSDKIRVREHVHVRWTIMDIVDSLDDYG